MSYQKLPSELLIQIFQNLSEFSSHPQDLYNCAIQCKLWCYCAIQLVWQKPTIIKVDTWMKLANTLTKQDQFMNYGSLVQKINLSSIANYMNDDSLAILSVCERLDRVTLAGCKTISDQGLAYFIRHAGHHLTCIDLSEISHITDRSLLEIANICRSLQGLNISLTDETEDGVTDENKSIFAFAAHCPSLIELDAANCTITNDSLIVLLNRSRGLRELKLNGCIHLNDHGFLHSSVSNYHQLRMLDLTGVGQITDRTIHWVITVAPKIRSLIMNKCENISNQAVRSIARLGRHLHFLHLGSCKQITDEAIVYLAEHCSRIRYIDLASCSHLGDDAVLALASLTKLKRIGLVRCEHITDRAIRALTHSPHTALSLERIHLSYCRQLTVAAVSDLVIHCKRLNHLSLSFIPAFQIPDFQQFRRDPPKDYGADARSFCVISGGSIHKLRTYIRVVSFAPIFFGHSNQ
ncbi:hypothetical protein RO3G_14387 [Rhizopus delemar RA 99-880]|uniref:Uncharacterized protein n=1 Tax=Rhizopus delemar (strain RA 99-880 / ATCC MYA-4621 / FGSC 9543 / NRRL 43880) TaxID=246409 RepID=I1CMJ6_RHIO9|nr:hypothetical protein RO3G_14387 [Rhizopus delemar RA 99-880]|eukprot:EIE89676.1 hypothetical protein RO3G_14387 [Rhizopus delemar RA 99-880]